MSMAPENYTQESDDHHSGTNTNFLIRLARPVRANADGHFPVKASEEIEQLVGGEAAEVPVHQVRDFRLFDTKQRRDLTLLELPVCQKIIDMKAQSRPREKLVGILKAQVREDIA